MAILTRSSSRSLSAFLKDSMIQDICNKNYVKFCDSMDNVITMRRDMKDLNVGCDALSLEVEKCVGFPRGDFVCGSEVRFTVVSDP